jgi:hypothetical protein
VISSKVAFLAVLVVGMLFVANVSAATLQGLEWGIEEEDGFGFDYVIESNGNSTKYELFINCTDIIAIPNIVDTWSELEPILFDSRFGNTTPINWEISYFAFYSIAINHFAIPIGNYSLLTELYEESIYNGTVVNEGGYWGVDLNYTIPNLYRIHVDFLKKDGMLAHYSFEDTVFNESLTMVRRGLPAFPELPWSYQLIISVVAVVIIVTIIRRREEST